MKKHVIILLVLFLLIQTISALDISIKSEYSPRETLQAEISGNFLSLTSENIQIYNNLKVHSEPVISSLTRQNNKYYYYAVLPNTEGNYSLRIENAKYTTSGNFTTETISKNFTIRKINNTALSINPGFIVVNKKDKSFSIKLTSLNGNNDANLVLDSETKTVSLIEDLEQTITFSTDSLVGNTNLKINDYTVPVFFSQTNQSEKKPIINFLPSKINGTIIRGKDYTFKIIVENIGLGNSTNIKLSSNFGAKINPEIIETLNSNEKAVINITIPSAQDFNGEITADYGEITSLPVSFNTTTNASEVQLAGTSVTESLSCADIGKICLANEQCDAETTSSLEGSCCLGQCVPQQQGSSLYTYIGIALIILILIILYFLYKKSKNKRGIKSSDDLLKDRSSKYSQRMSGSEVDDKLDRL